MESRNAFVAQLVERSLGKTEVSGSIPDKGSQLTSKLLRNLTKIVRQDTQAVNEGSL